MAGGTGQKTKITMRRSEEKEENPLNVGWECYFGKPEGLKKSLDIKNFDLKKIKNDIFLHLTPYFLLWHFARLKFFKPETYFF